MSAEEAGRLVRGARESLRSPSVEITERAVIGDDLVFERMVSEL